MSITDRIAELQEQKYREFQLKLMPTVSPESVLGVRVPLLRKLAKQYDKALPYIENKKLDTWVHNKTIQKAVESYRISDLQKEYLKSLKIKK